ncbi:hypothetical protein Kpol_1068p10 [Vanderwaltozyma polyspora DSM 70294]|uniref:Transcription initiation factor TFIID subunit 8 n=1 Tax=Vanderwaltozyma polyspora (strain ATCC 22028 / DSM 70294 / BCRC 21397 / CBS 2163 / NBRC 10782 / NRRL Y-8283 / UCD 57-17) TaxID=436907 RepID=A7TSR5_VANPO|nr:uncharacterized protein Kpol_1068p10 [Vanderwaltozyma polyspora DSM 70294]EDO14700.1 hypothetical protein Kpol_1068p10 [Vanderwaltozyma polyspora DSM 70294]
MTGEATKYIQLTELPTLTEYKYEETEPAIEKILAKAVALQLKSMNCDTSITKFAFEHLMSLVVGQIDDMVLELHRLSSLQRRNTVAKADISVWLRGFNLTPEDLEEQNQKSQYLSKLYDKDYESLTKIATTTTRTLSTYQKLDLTHKDTSTAQTSKLVPISNPLQKLIPSWLPDFPPDYTYKFTPQYNTPITDETIIRRKVVEEGKQSEKALLNLLRGGQEDRISRDLKFSSSEMELATEETLATYSAITLRNKHLTSFFEKEPIQNSLNVEEYARTRVEIERKKVLGYEERQLQIQRNPFLKISRLISANNDNKVSKSVANTEIRKYLKRSLLNFIHSIPKTQQERKEARERAEEEKERRLAEIKALKEEKLKEMEAKKSSDFNLLDLSNYPNDSHGGFFAALESSDEERELIIQPRLSSYTRNNSGVSSNETQADSVKNANENENENENEAIKAGKELENDTTDSVKDIPTEENKIHTDANTAATEKVETIQNNNSDDAKTAQDNEKETVEKTETAPAIENSEQTVKEPETTESNGIGSSTDTTKDKEPVISNPEEPQVNSDINEPTASSTTDTTLQQAQEPEKEEVEADNGQSIENVEPLTTAEPGSEPKPILD